MKDCFDSYINLHQKEEQITPINVPNFCINLLDALDLPLTVEEYLRAAHKQQEVLFPKVGYMPGMCTVIIKCQSL